MKFELAEVLEGQRRTVKGRAVTEGEDSNGVSRGLALSFDGYGDFGSAKGHGTPVLLEVHEGKLRLVVWSDINQEEPSHVIDLEGARELLRKPD